MTAVYCFSATGRCRPIADYFAQALSVPVHRAEDGPVDAQAAVIVFPVYCQNIPAPVSELLSQLKSSNLVLIAAYGRKSHGNVLQEAASMVSGTVIAAAYVPIGHSYLSEDIAIDCDLLSSILDRIANPKPAFLPRQHKSFWADLAPAFRSRLGVRLFRGDGCTHCGLCIHQCPMGAMTSAGPNLKCIRCLRCVQVCPQKAIHFRLTLPVRQYLSRKNHSDLHIYL